MWGTMLSLSNALSNSVNSLQSLSDMLGNSEVSLSSFWGSRVISVNEYEGTVLLDDVYEKYREFGNRNDIQYSLEECRAAVDIQSKLKGLYCDSDALIQNSWNIFVVFSRVMKSCAAFFL